jgi:hypothetical protein
MADVKELQTALGKITKTMSLRQVGLQSKIGYLTLRNIKLGKTKRVTEVVSERLRKFLEAYTPEGATKVKTTGKKGAAPDIQPQIKPRKRGRPKKQAAPAAAPRKRGRPKKQATVVAADKGGAAPVMYLGEALVKEIAVVKARLDWLLSLQKAEATYIRAIRK